MTLTVGTPCTLGAFGCSVAIFKRSSMEGRRRPGRGRAVAWVLVSGGVSGSLYLHRAGRLKIIVPPKDLALPRDSAKALAKDRCQHPAAVPEGAEVALAVDPAPLEARDLADLEAGAGNADIDQRLH